MEDGHTTNKCGVGEDGGKVDAALPIWEDGTNCVDLIGRPLCNVRDDMCFMLLVGRCSQEIDETAVYLKFIHATNCA